VVRLTFGYSFATWRFHLRGVPIRGGYDIGWLTDLTVGKLMRRDAQTIFSGTTVGDFRQRFPLGAATSVFVVDADNRFAGTVATADMHNPDLDDKLDQLLPEALQIATDQFLLPEQNVRVALGRFLSAETETLAVLDSARTLHVVGFLTEGYTLRRYNEELERSRTEEIGDRTLFGPV
jgi:CIC family chloride channel protein